MVEQTNKTKEAWYDECVALYEDGELAQAVAELKKLTAAHADYGLAWLALAVYSQKKGDDVAALEAMKQACELEQEDPFYFTAFSALALKCGDHELAEDALMKVQEARFAAQMKKMNELRKQELAARKELEERARQAEAETEGAEEKPE
ncbi:MAG: hypothetical protein HUK22_03835 [Thermoguttaceae bacterium]|nr:hypothetical protein [Thermoguttaceae bacterium]